MAICSRMICDCLLSGGVQIVGRLLTKTLIFLSFCFMILPGEATGS